MAWIKPQSTNKEVNRAGKSIIDPDCDPFEYEHAINVVNNWRSSHGFPLNSFQNTLRKRARAIDPTSSVAQRIKRLESIENKLKVNQNMALSQMQDIGGCRAILKTINHVNQLKERYESGGLQHEHIKTYDYINNPKRSGYRGIHLVYRYHTTRQYFETYNGLKIEIQLRSRLQHLWATAVETVGTFTGQALKASHGDTDWLHFFVLVGSAIAKMEGTPSVPDAPIDNELQQAVNAMYLKLRVESRLAAFTTATSYMARIPGAEIFLLKINIINRTLNIESFTKENQALAAQRYLEVERAAKQTPGHDAVLVSVDSIGVLKKTYPNYFADTSEFVATIKKYIAAQSS